MTPYSSIAGPLRQYGSLSDHCVKQERFNCVTLSSFITHYCQGPLISVDAERKRDWECVCVCAFVRADLPMCVCLCVRACVCLYVCMHMCVYVCGCTLQCGRLLVNLPHSNYQMHYFQITVGEGGSSCVLGQEGERGGGLFQIHQTKRKAPLSTDSGLHHRPTV